MAAAARSRARSAEVGETIATSTQRRAAPLNTAMSSLACSASVPHCMARCSVKAAQPCSPNHCASQSRTALRRRLRPGPKPHVRA
eukprot:6501172-Alexandrium_andersonii.AAC.1